MIQRLLHLFCLALLAAFLSGCGSKINQANFDKITTDMTCQQVEVVLGKPTETSTTDIGIASGGSSAWKDKNGTITIQFLNNKVMTKSFSATRQN